MAKTGPYNTTWEQYLKDLDQEFWDGEDNGWEKAIVRLKDQLELEMESGEPDPRFTEGLQHAIDVLIKESRARNKS